MPSPDSAIIFNAFLIYSPLFTADGDIIAWLQMATQWVATHIRESPAVVIGLTACLVFPAIAIAGSLLRLASARPANQHPLVSGRFHPPPGFVPLAPDQIGLLEFTYHQAAPFPLRHGIVRIGREKDNDVHLDDPSVHRYHAVIERTPDAEFHVVYIGDPEGNGVRVNGRKVERARLSGGEILDIGSTKLRFTLTSA